MDAIIIIVLALLVVIGAFYGLGVGRSGSTRQKKAGKGGGAYSKRSRRKR